VRRCGTHKPWCCGTSLTRSAYGAPDLSQGATVVGKLRIDFP
jgi:hypothetical protein